MSHIPVWAVTYLYGVPAGTVRRWLSEGKLKRHGRKPYSVETEDVEKLAARHIEAKKDTH